MYLTPKLATETEPVSGESARKRHNSHRETGPDSAQQLKRNHGYRPLTTPHESQKTGPGAAPKQARVPRIRSAQKRHIRFIPAQSLRDVCAVYASEAQHRTAGNTGSRYNNIKNALTKSMIQSKRA